MTTSYPTLSTISAALSDILYTEIISALNFKPKLDYTPYEELKVYLTEYEYITISSFINVTSLWQKVDGDVRVYEYANEVKRLRDRYISSLPDVKLSDDNIKKVVYIMSKYARYIVDSKISMVAVRLDTNCQYTIDLPVLDTLYIPHGEGLPEPSEIYETLMRDKGVLNKVKVNVISNVDNDIFKAAILSNTDKDRIFRMPERL